MFTRIVLCLAVAVASRAEQATVRYLDLPESALPQKVATDSAGNLFIVSNVTEPSGGSQIRVLKTDPQGGTLARMDFGGSQGGSIAGAAVDSSGNLVIVGTTIGTDFPLVSPLISNTSQEAAFVVKIDSQLTTLLFSTKLGGSQGPYVPMTTAGAMALDSAGNIYVTGSTSNTDFPVTPGAFQSQPPQGDAFGAAVYAFLTEISGDGKQILFSTYFGDGAVSCTGGSACIGAFGGTAASAIALDSSGNIVIAGGTTASQLPVTPGTYAQQCGCTSDHSVGFLAKFGGGGSKLLWATYLPVSGAFEGSDLEVTTMAIDTANDVIIGGSLSYDVMIPTTSGALQPSPPQSAAPISPGFLVKFDSAASQLLFSTYFGGSVYGTLVGAVVIDSQGAIWVTGASEPAELPVTAGTLLLGPAYLASLSSDGSTLTNIYTAPAGAAGQAITLSTQGTVIALGSAASLLIASPGQGPSLVGVANSAATKVSNAVAPYELVSLYGIGIGPATPATTQLVNGLVSTSLGGVEVLFDGIAAPLLYAGPTQINAVVPREVAGQDTTTLQIMTPSGVINGPTMLIRPSEPGVFSSGATDPLTFLPYAAALNQDGSVNSASNPAAYGSIVTIWATGCGSFLARADGAIVTTETAGLPFPVSVLGSNEGNEGRSLQVLYAGDAPGMVAGVSQINFQLPQQTILQYWTFQLQVGDEVSQPFEIYLSQ